MRARAYIAASYVDDTSMLHIGHVGPFNVLVQLSILTERLSTHV